MRVNSPFKVFFNNRVAVSSVIVILVLAIFFVASSFTKHSNRDLQAKRANLIVRDIGHRLLLLSGDSTSRVLPVTEIKEGTFLLAFENRLVISHDSLMALCQQLLTKDLFPSGYTITVHDCMNDDIVYGFQVSDTSMDILACKGRAEPVGCYTLEITFPDFYETTFDYPFVTLVCSGMLVLVSVGLLIGRFREHVVPALAQNHDHSTRIEPAAEMSALGKFLFDTKSQRLLLGKEVIALTEKECKVLELLNQNFGELISRETLMQKIWIDEGVITGRSLDMFVSKLRKKLSSDPQLKITNVHGKGYKLEAQMM